MKIPKYLMPFVGAVVANYMAQIPYTIHQYGLNFSTFGFLLLGSTLILFIISLWGFLTKKKWGYYLFLFFIILQVLFYFNNTFLSLLHGGGLIYHFQVSPFLAVIFLIGDLNGFIADYYLYYFLKNRKRLNNE